MNNDVRIGLIGAGRIGSNHAHLLAHAVPGARLVAICDPSPSGTALAQELGVSTVESQADPMLRRSDVDAVVICAPARSHTDLVVQAAEAGKHVFVEKPMAVTLRDADRAIAAVTAAGIQLQVGFNRRFAPGWAAARAAIDEGRVGTPQLLRSLTRDPGPFTADPGKIPPGTIFLETLIHDFDALCFLNPGARPVRVNAVAAALIRPDAQTAGHLDTAVVTVEFDNGAIATAEASFSALYGYDVRAEVFGSGGMVTAGCGRADDLTYYGPSGIQQATARSDTQLLRDAYRGEFVEFVRAVSTNTPPSVTGRDARTALSIAQAAMRSADCGAAVTIAEVEEVGA